MNWDAIGAIGELVGATAVVATLFYLAAQIRENSRATQIRNSQELNADTRAWWAKLGDNGELASIWRRGLTDFASLTPDEALRFSTTMQQVMTLGEELHHAERTSDVTGWVGGALKRGMPEIFGLPGFKRWYEQRGHWFTPEFRSWVESEMDGAESSAAPWYQPDQPS